MKQTLQIRVDFDKPALLQDVVEKLVSKPNTAFSLPALETASTEAYVFGTISMEEEGETLNIPFDGSFLFTCIRITESDFELTWSCSLS